MPGITTFQMRRGTASGWSSANPILAAGEVGFETDTKKMKFGDGTTAWNSLGYLLSGGFDVLFDQILSSDTASIDTGANAIPPGYNSILIRLLARTTQAAGISGAYLVFNGDTGAHYSRQYAYAQGGTQNAGSNASATPDTGAGFNVLGDSATAAAVSSAIMEILGYDKTTYHKTGIIESCCVAANNILHTKTSVEWGDTSAINRVALFAAANLLKAGSRLVVIGVGKPNVGVGASGTEIGYDEITSSVTVSGTTEAGGTTVISCAPHTFDGSPVMVEFFCEQAIAGDAITVSLFEGSTEITRLAVLAGGDNAALIGKRRFTPSAGAHTYTVTAFRASANGTLSAGVGGTATSAPCFVRFTKV